jgi:glycosyltransferase involved in cell wall biosynthesis
VNVLLLNTFDLTGGAARACHRLYEGLKAAEAHVATLVREQSGQVPGVVSVGSRLDGRLRALLDGLPLHRYPGRQLHNFSPAWMPGRAASAAIRRRPQLVHLHWVVQGFLQIEALASLACPIVWTLHDSWPFTGGCHLPGTCRGYEQNCGRCPVLGSQKEQDWSRRIWQRKRDAWENLSLTLVAPSSWLADRARASSLFAHRRIEVIPNGIESSLFCPGDRQAARRLLGLPEDRRLLLFGANHALSDANKGFDLLQEALLLLDEGARQTTELVIFGENWNRPLPDCGLPVTNLGAVAHEEQLLSLYHAADLFVAPSRQENLPNMVLEAMACATPCVAFDIGGIPDMIRHGVTGYLARPYEVEDLATGISLLLADESGRLAMGWASREWVQQHASIEIVAELHEKLYRELVSAYENVR